MKFEYKRVVTRSTADLLKAEALKSRGWKIISAIMFERVVK